MRLLVIEDEAKVARALDDGLSREGYEVTVARTGEEGYYLLDSAPFDLVVLDLMLPGRDGLEVLATMRSRNRGIPVLIVTARDSVEDRVIGLDAGADDYLVKPFAFAELLARIRALSRRGRSDAPVRLKVSDLEMDASTRRVSRGGRTLDLTAREFELLEYLVRNGGRVVSREMLARDVWKETGRATPLDNVIDVHIARLRRKVDDTAEPKLIHTVRGVGFMIGESTS
ncbi:MAG: DNA-binding response regulator [Acidobacteria bacterium]|nr:MAG: DNA-binding response regulator [Acidobacteriota bacterium]